MSSNPLQDYKDNYRANLPAGVTYDPVTADYFYNNKRFQTIQQVEWYRRYLFATEGFTSISAYAIAGFDPALVFDFSEEYYRTGGSVSTFDSAMTHTRSSNATMVDSQGFLKWAPHNLLTYSEDFSDGSWSKAGVTATADSVTEDSSTGNHRIFNSLGISVNAVSHTNSIDVKPNGRTRVKLTNNNLVGSTFDLIGDGTVVSGTGAITALADGWYRVENALTSPTSERLVLYLDNGSGLSYAGDGVSGVFIRKAQLYRSDLGGMVDNHDTGNSYVPTTSAARYLPRRGHHVWNGTAWVNEGLLHESEARTNLLLNSGTLATQDVTVTAVPHTLHFTGTGTVTLSGVSTAGPLVGTGAGENNRVSLTFTPTAGTLTITVSGTVTNADLEVGSTPSSHKPTSGSTVTRSADVITVPSANLPYSATAMSIQMDGKMTYADTAVSSEIRFVRWLADNTNYIISDYATDGAYDRMKFEQRATGTLDNVQNTSSPYSPGINVPYNIASRHGSTFINGSVNGTALTADTTPTALPDLSSTNLSLGFDYMGTIKKFRVWSDDLGDTGIAEAST